jgi:hypothetical protein
MHNDQASPIFYMKYAIDIRLRPGLESTCGAANRALFARIDSNREAEVSAHSVKFK